jgi:hypothetical protein
MASEFNGYSDQLGAGFLCRVGDNFHSTGFGGAPHERVTTLADERGELTGCCIVFFGDVLRRAKHTDVHGCSFARIAALGEDG